MLTVSDAGKAIEVYFTRRIALETPSGDINLYRGSMSASSDWADIHGSVPDKSPVSRNCCIFTVRSGHGAGDEDSKGSAHLSLDRDRPWLVKPSTAPFAMVL